jgi:maleate cis-trans isomerase
MGQSPAFLEMQRAQASIENVNFFSSRMNNFQLEVLFLLEKHNNEEARTLLEKQVEVLTSDLTGARYGSPYHTLLLQQIEEFKKMITLLL